MTATEKFSPAQKANTVLWYGVCGDTDVVQHKFKTVYSFGGKAPEPPTADEIKEWYKNFRHMGFIDVQDAVIHEEATGEPIHKVENRSKVKSVMSNVLNKLNTWFLDGPRIRSFHPNHMELITINDADVDERASFAKEQLDHVHKWSPILKSMWFTGEAKFYIDGRVEANNLVYTRTHKTDDSVSWPHRTVGVYHPSTQPFVTVWAAMNAELSIGPYFYDGELSAEAYRETLEKFIHELRQVTSSVDHPIFIQDDSNVHTGADVADYLEKQFPHRWIGTGSSYAAWPHHSPDLSPINFFLWGYIKSRVYKAPVTDFDELKERVRATFKNITPDLLEEAVDEYKTRLERVHKSNGDLVDATIYGQEVDFDKLNTWSMYAWPYV